MTKKISNASSCSTIISSSTTSCIAAVAPKKKANKRVSANDKSARSSHKGRSSIYRGVTRHRWTGRYEAHLWDKTVWNAHQNKRGKQVYLGAYDIEEEAAQAYDLAALKYWGAPAILNFTIERYTAELEVMKEMTKDGYLATLRRRSNGFSRGVSKFRGVARHHQNGRWEARIGRVSGNKYLYLGTYDTQEEAAAAYDRAAIEFRGPSAVTNFDISNYVDTLKKVVPEVKPEEVQVKEENTPRASNEEATATLDQSGLADQLTIPKLEPIAPVESQPMGVMDSNQGHEHPWDLCLDTGFNSFPIPDIPFENTSDVVGLFDDKKFGDCIEFTFDESLSDTAFLEDAMSGNDDERQLEDLEGANVSDKSSTSPESSSSVSTITSVVSVDSNVQCAGLEETI